MVLGIFGEELPIVGFLECKPHHHHTELEIPNNVCLPELNDKAILLKIPHISSLKPWEIKLVLARKLPPLPADPSSTVGCYAGHWGRVSHSCEPWELP